MNMGINEAGDRASTEVDDFCGGSGEPAFGRRVHRSNVVASDSERPVDR
jgi:hypothetical protein